MFYGSHFERIYMYVEWCTRNVSVCGKKNLCTDREYPIHYINNFTQNLIVQFHSGIYLLHLLGVGVPLSLSRVASASRADTKNTLSMPSLWSISVNSSHKNCRLRSRCCCFTSSTSSSNADISQRFCSINIFGFDSRALTLWKKFFSCKKKKSLSFLPSLYLWFLNEYKYIF